MDLRLWAATAVTLAAAASAQAAPSHAGGPQGWRVRTLPVPAHSPTSFSEPGLAAGPGRVLLASASSANSGNPATFWLSRDDGTTWSRATTVGDAATSTGDADTAIGPDGYLYALNLGYGAAPPAQPSNPTVLVFRSRDGRHWQGPASFPPPHGVDQPDRPWLVVTPGHPDDVVVFNSEVGGNIVEWRSTDHGASFAGPTPVTGGLNSEAALTLGSRPLVDPAAPRRMALLYETATWAGLSPATASRGPVEFPLTQLWVATSSDGGRSWRHRLVLDLVTAFGAHAAGGSLGHLLPASAVAPDGTLYAAVSARLGSSTRTRLYVVDSTDHGRHWSRPLAIPTATASNVMPALAAGHGRLHLSWYGSDASSFADTDARWSEWYAAVRTPLGPRPQVVMRRLSGAGPVHVGAVESAGAVGNDLGENWALRDFQSITLDGCGQPHVVWADDYRGRRTVTATPRAGCPRGSR